jgi:hypothetical protein
LIKYLLVLSAFFTVAWCPAAIDTLTIVDSCGQASETTIIGEDTEGGSLVTHSAGDIIASRFQADYNCSIDEIRYFVNDSFTDTEKLTMGLYDDSGNLIAVTAEIDGDDWATPVWAVATMTAQALTSGQYYWLAAHASANIQYKRHSTGQPAGEKMEVISGEAYSGGSLPASLDFSAATDEQSNSIYAVNP